MMEYLRFGLALLFVLGLIWGCSWFGRRMGLTPRVRGATGPGRLSIIEVQAVDAKRKLVLIRRDNVEHLILLNGERDLLIESGIALDGGQKAEDRKQKEEDGRLLSSIIRPLSSVKP